MSIRESFPFLSVAMVVVGAGCNSAGEPAHAEVRSDQNNSHEVAATAKGVAAPGPPASSDASCDLPTNRPDLTDCPSASCGGNSPILNAFPYNGLHPDGCHNADGVKMAPGALVRDVSSCDVTGTGRLTLDIAPADPRSQSAGYELVAKDVNDNIKCRGADLIGATFQVITPKLSNAIVLRISQMGTTTVRGAGTTSQDKRTTYLITPSDRPASSVCTSPPPESAHIAAPSPALANQPTKDGGLAPILDSDLAGYAIIIPGAVYTPGARLIKESVRSGTAKDAARGHRWFNIACVGDALAESELSAIATDPIVNVETATARLPALHMFTARYCDGLSGTTRGTPIAWLRSKRPSKGRTAGAAVHSAAFTGTEPIEAQWGPDGVTCLRHSRLWMANKTISLPDQLLEHKAFQDPAHPVVYPMAESEFLSRLCPGITRTCGDPRKPDTLTSFAIDHVDDAD